MRLAFPLVAALAALRCAAGAELCADEPETRDGAGGPAACIVAAAQALIAAGDHGRARDEIERGLQVAGSAAAAASLLNELGRIHMAEQQPLPALAAFADSHRLAPAGSALRVAAGINLARATAEATTGRANLETLDALREAALAIDDPRVGAATALALAGLYREHGRGVAASELSGARGFALAERALELARPLSDGALLAEAYGELADWHAARRDYARALPLARQAALTAQAGGHATSAYLAEWRTGRLLRTLGRAGDALAAYRSAVATLAATQAVLVTSDRRFTRDVLPLYNEYADVMFASTMGLAPAARRERLGELQTTLERLRLAEVSNYFENQCVIPDVVDPRARLSRRAIVIYPVVFADRTEILISTADELLQFTARVGRDELGATVRLLRDALENSRSGDAYLEPARQIYEWLIAPAVPAIEAAAPEVLVIVPDGSLRTVPLGALHDGERFLIERFAVATTPGLSLIGSDEPQPIRRVLASGISEAVQGFAPLPFVAQELERVAAAYPARVYADAGFLSTTFEREILQGGYSIVHLATHAQFDADYERSFLLAYDDLITLDELEDVIGGQRYSQRPVDLLVLSACQTAAGDDRAALGLAGVAVKAGAKAALASLWLIDDESTARLIAEFYRQLGASGSTKAAALRGAQLLLMNDRRFGHPAFWAPFLLIGDWR